MNFYKRHILKATKPMIKQYLSHVCKNPGGTAAGLRTRDMGSRLAFDTNQLCDNARVTFPLWPPASVLVNHSHVKISTVSVVYNNKQ